MKIEDDLRYACPRYAIRRCEKGDALVDLAVRNADGCRPDARLTVQMYHQIVKPRVIVSIALVCINILVIIRVNIAGNVMGCSLAPEEGVVARENIRGW